jgi:hypothetical protein
VRLELVLPGASSTDGAPPSPNDNPLPRSSPHPRPCRESTVAWPRPCPASVAVTWSASCNMIVPSTGVRLVGIAFHDQHAEVAESKCCWRPGALMLGLEIGGKLVLVEAVEGTPVFCGADAAAAYRTTSNVM